MNTIDTSNLVSVERRRLADTLAGLTPEQLSTPSQCERWTVGDVAAHVITPFETSTPAFLMAMARSRFDFDKTMVRLTSRIASGNTIDEIVAKLRANSENRWTPPKAGPQVVLAEVLVHGQDIRRVLGLDHDIPTATFEHALAGIEDPDARADYVRRIGQPDLAATG